MDVVLRGGDGEVVADEEASGEGVVGVGGEVRDTRVAGAQVELIVDEAEGLAAVIGARVVDVVAGLVRVVTHVAPHGVDGAVRADVDGGEELDVLGVIVVEDLGAAPGGAAIPRGHQEDVAVVVGLVRGPARVGDVDLAVRSRRDLRERGWPRSGSRRCAAGTPSSLKAEATTGADQVRPASSELAIQISPTPFWESSSVLSIQATCTAPSGVTVGWLPCTTRRVPKTPAASLPSPCSP